MFTRQGYSLFLDLCMLLYCVVLCISYFIMLCLYRLPEYNIVVFADFGQSLLPQRVYTLPPESPFTPGVPLGPDSPRFPGGPKQVI